MDPDATHDKGVAVNSITYDICGEQKVVKVESDLILVIFMGESRKWLINALIHCGQ
jgi:hypothetical protein